MKANGPLLRNIFTPGGSAPPVPALIATKASSSRRGVGFHVIIISPCYGRARAVSGYVKRGHHRAHKGTASSRRQDQKTQLEHFDKLKSQDKIQQARSEPVKKP
jgi:hypothetical protein